MCRIINVLGAFHFKRCTYCTYIALTSESFCCLYIVHILELHRDIPLRLIELKVWGSLRLISIICAIIGTKESLATYVVHLYLYVKVRKIFAKRSLSGVTTVDYSPHKTTIPQKATSLQSSKAFELHITGIATYQSFKRDIQRKCRKAYYNYMEKLTDENGAITKRLWTYIKSQRKDYFGVAL